MPDPTDPTPEVTSAIENAVLSGAKSATGDNGSMTAFDLKDQIEADRYLAGKKAGLGRGFRLSRIIPGGTVRPRPGRFGEGCW